MSKAVAKKEDAPITMTGDEALIYLVDRMARDTTVDVARVEKMLELRRQEADRAARKSYLAAFSRLQAKLPAVMRKGTGHNNKKYARYEDLIGTIRAPLAEEQFSISFRIRQESSVIHVAGVLGHAEGHQEETEISLPADTSGNKNVVQAHGSTISYGKRYVAMTLLGIATEDEDDDGKKAAAPVERITEEQAKALKALMEKAGVDEQIIREHFKVSSLEEMSVEQHKTATSKLNKKMGQA
jgi:hypothetical protein